MYSRHRFPSEIISYCVWLYYTFPLSYRDIEKMMLYRGIEVSYETIREWCEKFGQQYANQLRHKRPFIAEQWQLDQVVVTIKKQQYYLWRAVDSECSCWMCYGNGIVTRRQQSDYQRTLLKKQGFVPRGIVPDKLKSYAAANKQVLKNVEHRQHKGLNNRAENSHNSDTSSRATNATKQNRSVKPSALFACWDRCETTSTRNNIN